MELVDRREYKRLSRAGRELARGLEAMELVDRSLLTAGSTSERLKIVRSLSVR
jgi:hypothetical protein